MNKDTEDKLSKALHNAIEKALNEKYEDDKLNEELNNLYYNICKNNGFDIHNSDDIKPMTYDNIDDYYGEEFKKYINADYSFPFKKGEFYVRYDYKDLNESSQIYPKPQKLEKIISELVCVGLTEDNYFIPKLEKDSNGIYGYILIAFTPVMFQKGHFTFVLEAMHKMGYFLAKSTPKTCTHNVLGKIAVFQFEPYYYTRYKLTIKDLLLHASPLKNKSSIMKHGFVAGCNNKIYQYPSRVYFFTKFKESSVYTLFYKGGVFTNNEGRNEYVKFFMDTNKLMEAGIEFYSDPMFEKELAVYTYESVIPSTYIKNVEHDLI